MLYDINNSFHLAETNRINLGSFYTPYKYVKLIENWLLAENLPEHSIIADLTCGGGAFFELTKTFTNMDFIGNDIDLTALEMAKKYFPKVNFFSTNTFSDVCRQKFDIPQHSNLVIVGNPPWNDVTSQVNGSKKKEVFKIDMNIKTRDLGMSSLLSYDKLSAEYVAILHPLSYLIKLANFNACKSFFSNYTMINHIIFNSQEFANTSKLNGFPVIVCLYKRTEKKGLTYDDIQKMKFKTVEGQSFSLDSRDYIADYIDKYPHNKRYTPEILFYTQRDINALKRCTTFMKKRTSASVDVDPSNLKFYCYLDCFKRFANVPYYLGNFNVPFIKETFDEISADVIDIAKYYHRDIFEDNHKLIQSQIDKVKQYINQVLTFKSEVKNGI